MISSTKVHIVTVYTGIFVEQMSLARVVGDIVSGVRELCKLLKWNSELDSLMKSYRELRKDVRDWAKWLWDKEFYLRVF